LFIRLEKRIMKKYLALLFISAVAVNLHGQTKFRDQRDGYLYRIISVQGVTWMAENLRFKAPQGASYFDNNQSNLEKYGMLYDWKTAVKVCPPGWRLPTGAEYQSLLTNNEENGNWKGKPADPNSFGIQLGGMQDHEGNFTELDEAAYFWTSTEYDRENAEYFSYMLVTDKMVVDVSRREDMADIHGAEKTNKYSVRCVKGK
jgi:uncharacterized protein (TIGR02145 family)